MAESDESIAHQMRKLRRLRVQRHARSLVSTLAKRFNFDDKIRGIELGVEEGRTAEAMLACFPRLRLTAVDCWTCGTHTTDWTQEQQDNNLVSAMLRIRQYRSRVRLLMQTTDDAVHQLRRGRYDFVFLDANHSKEGVAADLKNYSRLLRKGGFICGHDYGGVGDGTGRFGVKPAVDEFCEQNKITNFYRDPGSLIYWFRLDNKVVP